MKTERHPTAFCRIIQDPAGTRYRFFCELSGMALYTSAPLPDVSREEGLRIAWETGGRDRFNRCPKCGRWVSDPMYNPDMLQCVDCAPWQEKPNYCSRCGQKASAEETFCRACGKRLRYGEVIA